MTDDGLATQQLTITILTQNEKRMVNFRKQEQAIGELR